MKYRDLVLVVCMVAIVVIYWGLSGETAPLPQPAAALAHTTPTPSAPSPQPSKAVVTISPSAKGAFQRVEQPTLELTIKERTENLSDLVLLAKISTGRETVLPMVSKDTPRVSLTLSSGELNGLYQSPDYFRNADRILKKGESFQWEIPLRSLVPPKNSGELELLYGKKPLELSVMIVEGSSEPNPYSRRIMMAIVGKVTLEP